jgi:type II secretory pathway pseudopilin PulG
VRRKNGFTLLEICLAIFIAVLLVTLAVPSMSGLLAERKLKRSFESFDALARDAQAQSLTERRAYVIAWDAKGLALRPQQPRNAGEEQGARLDFADKETFDLNLPAALVPKPRREWIFWPTGTCEPATVFYHGAAGAWTADYDPLTVRAELATK